MPATKERVPVKKIHRPFEEERDLEAYSRIFQEEIRREEKEDFEQEWDALFETD